MKHRSLAGIFLALSLISAYNLPLMAPKAQGATMVSQEEYYNWLQSNSRTLSKRINKLDKEPVQNLPMPILFGVSPSTISPNFGDPRSGGRAHEGEDIMAPKGAPIISPTEAVVLETGVWAGAGNYVSTANPGGEKFVYMHLDWIADLKPGDTLGPGDLIGYVGNTGNAAGGPSHLHFEIHTDRPIDPFPRLKAEFTLKQKVGFLEGILDDAKDEEALAKFLVANYRGDLLAAQALGLDLPRVIEKEMSATPASGTTATFPGDLTLGSKGAEVATLQVFLISQNKGPAAQALAGAGATGNFGPVTKTALIEYQRSAGITPADGYYGPLTRAYVQQAKPSGNIAQASGSSAAVTPTANNPVPVSAAANVAQASIPARDLKLGTTGNDVIWLQAFLIATKSGPAAATLAASGATGYFGPATQAALAEYQAKAGLSPAAGYFGAETRKYVATLLKAA